MEIRGNLTKEVNIESTSGFERDITFKTGDLISLKIDKKTEFLNGLILEITLSSSLKKYAEGFTYYLFNNVNPDPDNIQNVFTGDKIFSGILPVTNKFYVYIPLEQLYKDSIRTSLNSIVLPQIVKAGSFPVLFQIQPGIKDIPNSILQRDFYLKIRPEVKKIGYVLLKIIKPEGFEDTPHTVFIDDEFVESTDKLILLDSGIHRLKVLSPPLTEETISFNIEPGRTLDLKVPLTHESTGILLDLSPDAIVFLDGKKVDFIKGNVIPVTAGSHSLRVKMGEYTVTKKFSVKSGKKYTISLIFNLEIKED
ncbi:MAG: hypothetical protein JW969_07555 [Spirochaetales bacterium]|nr:hypothetical protein [Spirochaetales bacterium]